MSGATPGSTSGTGTRPARLLRVLVVNGPNLDLLGSREPAIYGRETLAEINAGITERAAALGLDVDFYQSNHEGAIIDRLHVRDFDAAVVNAAGLTHTSVSLRDALLGIERPFVEVHLSDPATREPFRRVNFLEDIAVARFVGLKAAGYHRALEELARRRDAGEIEPRATGGDAGAKDRAGDAGKATGGDANDRPREAGDATGGDAGDRPGEAEDATGGDAGDRPGEAGDETDARA